jgi:hypothetical protein
VLGSIERQEREFWLASLLASRAEEIQARRFRNGNTTGSSDQLRSEEANELIEVDMSLTTFFARNEVYCHPFDLTGREPLEVILLYGIFTDLAARINLHNRDNKERFM